MRTRLTHLQDESIDITINLNIDKSRSEERIRGTALLPYGTGKSVRVAVFARDELADAAREAGADVVGAEDLVEEIMGGRLDFERAFATPDVMPVLAKAARKLGPKGLMPNPKRGTVITDVGDAVRRSKGGEVIFKVPPKHAMVHSSIGRVSFPTEHLRANALALVYARAP